MTIKDFTILHKYNYIKNRTTFISLLGRISFIGVAIQMAYGIILLLGGIVMASEKEVIVNPDNSISIGMDNFNGLNDALDSTNSLLANQTTLGIISIVAALICLLGIIWMWKLKKKGYYVYIVGEIAPVVATIVLVGFSFAGAMAMIGFIFPILFIILWGLKLKHMS